MAPREATGTTDQRDVAGGGDARVTWEAGPSLFTAGALASLERLDSTASGDHQRATFAAWAADDFTIGKEAARISPAVRVDAVGPYVGVSAKLGASARIDGPWSVRASGGRSFRPPSFSELYLVQGPFEPNPDLRPEVAWSVDGALVLRRAAGPGQRWAASAPSTTTSSSTRPAGSRGASSRRTPCAPRRRGSSSSS